jgi:TRAP-type C4-dicarboxylate transport system permease small subunit
MKKNSFDKICGAAIIVSIGYSVFAAASWEWFTTPGDWGDIARIPPSARNYFALLLPPVMVLMYLVIRRSFFKIKSSESNEFEKQKND